MSPAANSLLTYVAQIDTIWVNFSVSENDMLACRAEKASRPAAHAGPRTSYVVEVVLADGSVFPHKGRITFANADYNAKTGTFLLRATIPNPDAVLRPGQFVRVRIPGPSVRTPSWSRRRRCSRGPRGTSWSWSDKENKAQIRPVAGRPLARRRLVHHSAASKAGDRGGDDGVVHLTPGRAGARSSRPPRRRPSPAAPAAAGVRRRRREVASRRPAPCSPTSSSTGRSSRSVIAWSSPSPGLVAMVAAADRPVPADHARSRSR